MQDQRDMNTHLYNRVAGIMFPCCLIFGITPALLGVAFLPATGQHLSTCGGSNLVLQWLGCWLTQQQRLRPLIFSKLPVCHNLLVQLWELPPSSCMGALHSQGWCSTDMHDNSLLSFSQSLLIALIGPWKVLKYLRCDRGEISALLLELTLKSRPWHEFFEQRNVPLLSVTGLAWSENSQSVTPFACFVKKKMLSKRR